MGVPFTPPSLSIDGSASGNSASFRPKLGSTAVTAWVLPTGAGTFVFQRKDAAGNWNSMGTTYTCTANTEKAATITDVADEVRIRFTDTSTSANVVRTTFIDGGHRT